MITPSFGLTATERVLPRLALDFTTASLDPRVTFTRAGNTATVINSSGLVAGVNADIPRFDYDPVTLVCRGLLIEEARTNLYTYSANLADASWVTSSCTTLANQDTAPDGTVTAARATFSANGLLYKNAVPNAAGTYSMSVWMRSATGSNQSIRFFGNGVTTFSAVQTVTTAWQRFTFTFTYASATSGFTTASGGIADVYIWGAQVEAGAFATSYIPTVASQVTRSGDVASMTGTNFSNWYNASEGAFFGQALLGVAAQLPAIATARAATSDAISFGFFGASQLTTQIWVGGANQLNIGSSGINNAVNRVCFTYKLDNSATATNGASLQTDTSCLIPTVNALYIGQNRVTTISCIHIQKISYYPQRLTNNEVLAFSKV
jgi:hypothetical protein